MHVWAIAVVSRIQLGVVSEYTGCIFSKTGVSLVQQPSKHTPCYLTTHTPFTCTIPYVDGGACVFRDSKSSSRRSASRARRG